MNHCKVICIFCHVARIKSRSDQRDSLKEVCIEGTAHSRASTLTSQFHLGRGYAYQYKQRSASELSADPFVAVEEHISGSRIRVLTCAGLVSRPSANIKGAAQEPSDYSKSTSKGSCGNLHIICLPPYLTRAANMCIREVKNN